jgi:hypothetical protein
LWRLVVSEEFQTNELMLSVSYGIEDHLFKFVPRQGSLEVYVLLLMYAKKSGEGKGIYSFSTAEIIERLSNPRGQNENPDVFDRTSFTRIIKHLQRIKMIEVLHRPSGRYDSLWTIRICKYKGLDNFLCLKRRRKSTVAEPLQDSNGADEVVTQATVRQSELFDDLHAQEKGYEADLPLQISNARDNKSNSINRDYINKLPEDLRKIKIKIKDKDNKEGKHKYLWDVLEELRLSRQSAEEILSPEDACSYVQQLMIQINGEHFQVACVKIRNELFRRYWNALRNGSRKNILKKCQHIGEKRGAHLRARFQAEFFRNHWAEAMIEVKNSPMCVGEVSWSNWTATFDWFIKNDNNVVKAVEGVYRARSEPQTTSGPRGRIIRQVSGKNYLRGAPLSAIEDFDLEDWIEANPEDAAKARESGVLDMRLRKQAETDRTE